MDGTGETPTLPLNYEGIVNLLTREYPGMSGRSQQIARFLTQNPNAVALESINAVAVGCGVHPSALMRFAQHLGYSGFKQMQSVFQTRLATTAPGFAEAHYVLEGDLLNDGVEFGPGGYITYGPGVVHGPHSSKHGCRVLTVQTGHLGPEQSDHRVVGGTEHRSS